MNNLLYRDELEKIEKAYKPVAIRKNGLGNCVISYNTDDKSFIVSVNGKLSGPFVLGEIEAIRDNFSDLLEMRGMYLFMSHFDIYGGEK